MAPSRLLLSLLSAVAFAAGRKLSSRARKHLLANHCPSEAYAGQRNVIPSDNYDYLQSSDLHDRAPLLVSLWPLPTTFTFGAGSIALAENFTFSLPQGLPPMVAAFMSAAFERYYSILSQSQQRSQRVTSTALLQVLVNISLDAVSPYLGVDESYNLTIDTSAQAALSCLTVFGCLRGLETFSQLVQYSPEDNGRTVWGVPVFIQDAPRFTHRGVLIDTSRHFLPMQTIMAVLDGMVYDKLNTLHWHITDVQSFPYASDTPTLAVLAQGAWAPTATYSPTQLKQIVEYARLRGIRVMPEIDTPAHSASWGVGRPDVVLPCAADPYSSLLDPTKNATYELIQQLFTELASIFPDAVFHAGGDEVATGTYDGTTDVSCYDAPCVRAWMITQNMTEGDWKAVARYHIYRMQDIVVNKLNRSMGLWEEALDHYGPGTTNPTPPPPELLPSSTIVHTWLCPCWGWWNMSAFVSAGFRGVKQDSWYLSDPTVTWQAAYVADPTNNADSCDYSAGWANCTCSATSNNGLGCFNITQGEEVERVLGGEASIWGEEADESNLLGLLWPRVSAVGERLWSPIHINDIAQAQQRLVDHICRMKARGIPASPIQAGWCDGSRR